ncbi:peptide-N(4)-(N-acetyl-beta-glucosaminyl) asparagine amidase [Tanacetum coccineum]|uniref:Peptide-N(4)-(N-acetyl-beta-glucosaminyl)asparagine amidase n=1 Tax=Tanacetum coccineum TaxID=301880 RepID=A0ABQ5JBL4_9ASTR
MVVKKLRVHHENSELKVEYETEDGLEILGGEDDRLISHDSDLLSHNHLRLIHNNNNNSDEEFARMLQAEEEEEALMLQQLAVSADNDQFQHTLGPYVNQILMYEDPHRQEAARRTLPVEKLEEKALVALAKEGNFNPSKSELDHAFLLQLLFWFNRHLSCGNETSNRGMGVANSSETAYGASRVELYGCNVCSRTTRFPRYNDPIKLLETKKGRCGEWANCFSLYCRSFGYETRLVYDFTDHVWTECYSVFLGRWMHLDPCEGIYDTPLLYEKGWNKKLNYTKDGVYDVTKRYTRKWHEVLSRRTLTTETAVSNTLANITRECRRNMTSAISALEERDLKEIQELNQNLHSQIDDVVSLPGRLSGDKEWRTLRSEIGSDSLSSSSCPVRRCIDEHVSRIYNAFSPLISRLAEFSSKPKALEALNFVRGVLIDLKKSPFKTRRVVIDLNMIREVLPSFNPMLEALSLKCKVETNGKVEICLADDPVRASLAFPVVFHALDDVIYNIKACGDLSKSSLSWPLLKLNRICGGSVLASGEELPFGIATSAFDGNRMTKWEEPNGAKGCWLIYKAMGDQVYELCSYELMSANDAPERDPKNWVVEGSDDHGSNWKILDEQTSQMFNNRFQRKVYKVKLQGFFANVFSCGWDTEFPSLDYVLGHSYTLKMAPLKSASSLESLKLLNTVLITKKVSFRALEVPYYSHVTEVWIEEMLENGPWIRNVQDGRKKKTLFVYKRKEDAKKANKVRLWLRCGTYPRPMLYVLSTLMPEFVKNETLEQTRKRCKWENDDYICRGHILNGMSDALFDVYQKVGSAKELWDQLESKYMAEDASSKKFLVSTFNTYKMVDSRFVMEQYHELLRILGQFTQHGLKMDESISMSSIIDKHTLKHNKDELSLVQLGSHFRVEKTLRAE